MFNPSSSPNGLPKTRQQALLEARAKARAAEAKTPPIRCTTPPAQFATARVPATRRVVFSNRVRVQKYNPGAAPERIPGYLLSSESSIHVGVRAISHSSVVFFPNPLPCSTLLQFRARKQGSAWMSEGPHTRVY
ncbi:hypothetical protein FRC02_007922 [Tulasnella sp. 418]|nr:hypothetical protein FRC02_007922 [Tulasnella sp. 418]